MFGGEKGQLQLATGGGGNIVVPDRERAIKLKAG